jgi:hypothetical protein
MRVVRQVEGLTHSGLQRTPSLTQEKERKLLRPRQWND